MVAHLNHADVEYHENHVFTTEEQNVLSNEAKLIADFIGNHTANESGDILLDNGETVEIKTVSAGSGTYFNIILLSSVLTLKSTWKNVAN